MKRIQPKRIISFRLDYELEKHLDSKPNTSKYLNSLIKEDYQRAHSTSLYGAIKQKMLDDEEFLAQLANKAQGATYDPLPGIDI